MPTQLQELIREGESERVEFERSLSDRRRIVETIAAMATLGGGTVLVGVRDVGRVVGVDLGEGALEQFSQRVLAATDPQLFVWLQVDNSLERPVLRIDVPPGDGPHLAGGRAFTRSGPSTVSMSRNEYERRLLDRLRESVGYERQVVEDLDLDDVDLDVMRRFSELAEARGVVWDGEPSSLLDRLHLLRVGRLTIGAVLLFGRHPQRVLPQSTLRMRVDRGTIEEGLAIDGPPMAQLDDAVRQVRLRLRYRTDRTDLVRREVGELPLAAVREAVVNALVHRDYRSTAPVQVNLTDDRLTVWSPGHLPSPLTVASLRRVHPSIPSNPRIARAMYLAGFIEEWGTGTLRIVDSMREHGNGEPLFEAPLGGVSVTLLGAEEATLTRRQASVVHLLRSAGSAA